MNQPFASEHGAPITLSAPVARLTYTCPQCTKPVFIREGGEYQVIGQQHWLQGGDTLIYDHCVPAEAHPWVWSGHLMGGTCPHCAGEYYIVDLRVMTSPVEYVSGEVPHYCFEALEPLKGMTFYQATSDDHHRCPMDD